MLHIPTADLQANAYAENSITLSAQRVAALIAGIILSGWITVRDIDMFNRMGTVPSQSDTGG